MTIYLLKMIACSAAFYTLYHFVFQREKMLVFNRVYLMVSLVMSFCIPLITFSVEGTQTTAPVATYTAISETVASPDQNQDSYRNLENMLFTLLAIVSCFLLIRLVVNLLTLTGKIRNLIKVDCSNSKIVLLENEMTTYSFMNYIFVNKADYSNGRIEEDILTHELAHVEQKHSWDIIFIELLQIVSWFNPFLYLFKRAIKINHEFLADEAVIKSTNDPLNYQQLLLQSLCVSDSMPLASSFFFTTKKRLIMLHRKFNRTNALKKGLLLAPVLALLVLVFSNRVYSQVPAPPPPPAPAKAKKLPDNVATVRVHSKDGLKTAEILYKNGKKVKEDISTNDKEKAFEKKYGVALAPPPPPAPPKRPSGPPAPAVRKQASFTNFIWTKNLVRSKEGC